jgi:drug/metabolite transporter (DMT)-like permease
VAIFYATGRRLRWEAFKLAWPGGLAFVADIVLYFSALKRTTVANATVVGALQPALVMLVVGPMFGEAVTRGLMFWSGVAIAGVVVVMYGGSGAPVWSLAGDLMAVAALFAWTAYFIVSKRVRRDVAPFEYLTCMMIVAVLVITPIALLSGQRLDPGGVDAWLWITALAIGSGGVGHLLINWAHDHVDLAVMSLLTLAVPVFAVASAAIFLSEGITPLQAVGMLIVLVSLGVVCVRTAREGREAPEPAEAPDVIPASEPIGVLLEPEHP